MLESSELCFFNGDDVFFFKLKLVKPHAKLSRDISGHTILGMSSNYFNFTFKT